jgi:hypothetical protein
MSYEESHNGLGVMSEHVVIDLGPSHLRSFETVIDPVKVAELPTLLWCPHGHEDAVRSLRPVVDVMLLDSDDLPDPPEAFARAAHELESSYVVDLAWLRTTPWRERIAASFDPSRRRCHLETLSELTIRHRDSSRSSALLLAGWLSSRVGWEARELASAYRSGLRGTAGSVEVKLQPSDQDVPGLAGVTLTCGGGFSLSLDRARGGLRALERGPDAPKRVWLVLGASRGEGGILGEGVRQALLRDPTYGPALTAARAMAPS